MELKVLKVVEPWIERVIYYLLHFQDHNMNTTELQEEVIGSVMRPHGSF